MYMSAYEQLQRGALTYKMTYKEQLKTQALSTRSSSGVEERQKIIKEEGSKEEDRQKVEVKYKCQCIDYLTRATTCKHIHAVQMKLNANLTENENRVE